MIGKPQDNGSKEVITSFDDELDRILQESLSHGPLFRFLTYLKYGRNIFRELPEQRLHAEEIFAEAVYLSVVRLSGANSDFPNVVRDYPGYQRRDDVLGHFAAFDDYETAHGFLASKKTGYPSLMSFIRACNKTLISSAGCGIDFIVEGENFFLTKQMCRTLVNNFGHMLNVYRVAGYPLIYNPAQHRLSANQLDAIVNFALDSPLNLNTDFIYGSFEGRRRNILVLLVEISDLPLNYLGEIEKLREFVRSIDPYMRVVGPDLPRECAMEISQVELALKLDISPPS